jgi:hypothetical protein
MLLPQIPHAVEMGREVMLTHAWRAPVSGAKGAGGTCRELTINSGRGLINIAHNLAIF